MHPAFNLPNGIILLITDELAAPADFVLHQYLSTHLKDGKKAGVIALISDGIARWKSLALKSVGGLFYNFDLNQHVAKNINLQHHIDAKGSLEFLDILSLVKPNEKNTLKDLVERIQRSVTRFAESGATILVVLDDISMLAWVGFDAVDIVRFLRALRAECLKANATLLVRHHIVTPGEPDDMFRHLLQICTYHLEVRPLASGRSGTVTGEVALHAGFSVPILSNVRLIPRSAALQYRLTDSGPVFFAKGTSEVVL